ncbi:MAG: lipoyl(octanoyl) [Geobacteraceae bacterium]|nr:MAG: lipoyl(octanoyl) [Geobacteraceae bacterium]
MIFMNVIDLDLIDFAEAYAIQERLAADVFAGQAPETLLLLEHPPVYTIGSGGREENILDHGVSAVRINRGGDVTFHGPGQLVGYPIIDLGRRSRDLHRYLRFLEEMLILAAADYGVNACRVAGRTGVWTGRGKIASIGVGVRRWITMHGFALNVAPDLAGFARINPCGMANCPITSLSLENGAFVPISDVKARIGARFETMLNAWLPLRRDRDAGAYGRQY